MGEIMTPSSAGFDPWTEVFNTPIECGLRSAVLLLAAFPSSCDLQRLVQYDYLIVHSGDVPGGPPSIHPATPHRAGELLVRRNLVQLGIEFMTERQVIEQAFTSKGIEYVAGEFSVVFVDSLKSEYTQKLRERAAWIVENFQSLPDEQLTAFMRDHWSQWGTEFIQDSGA